MRGSDVRQRALRSTAIVANVRCRCYRIDSMRKEDVSVERYLGKIGFLDVDLTKHERKTTIREGGLEIRMYVGRVIRGQSYNARVRLKAYPSKDQAVGIMAQRLAENEIQIHTAMQPLDSSHVSVHPRLCKLMGSFETESGPTPGEKWLVFRDDWTHTFAQYSLMAAEASSKGTSVGPGEFWDRLDPMLPLARRGRMVRNVMRQAMEGLAYMHSRQFLHQSLGPNSVVLRGMDEREPERIEARLCDLAFGVDVRDAALRERNQAPGLSESLWHRAAQEGADTESEMRAYGMADDVYSAGLLLTYACFVPFCKPGTVDGPLLRQLLEATFGLDVMAFREFCTADERWQQAVGFLDMGNGFGWSLIEKMLSKEWRNRPTAQWCLDHPFLRNSWQF